MKKLIKRYSFCSINYLAISYAIIIFKSHDHVPKKSKTFPVTMMENSACKEGKLYLEMKRSLNKAMMTHNVKYISGLVKRYFFRYG